MKQQRVAAKRRNIHQLGNLLLALVLALAVGVISAAAPSRAVASQAKVAIVGATGARLLATPHGDLLSALPAGELLDAMARTEEGDWLFVQTPADLDGWVAATELVIFGAASLPVRVIEPVGRSASSSAPAAATPISQPDETEPISDPLEVATDGDVTERAGAPEARTATVDTSLLTAEEQTPGMAIAQMIAPATTEITAEILAKGLNVRSGPGMEYGILTQVREGERHVVQARNEAGGWLQIELADGRTGWVGASYVQLSAALAGLPVAAAPAAGATQVTPPPEAAPVAAQPAAPRTDPTGLTGTLVFSSGNGGLFYRYDLATGELHPLTHGIDPAISPDGSQVAFTRVGGESGVYLINIDGSGERKIFGERELLSSAKWSPDGRWIIFSRLDGTYSCFDLGRNGICVAASELVPSPPAGLTDEQLEQFNARRPSILSRFDRQDRPNWALARINTDGGDYRDIAALDSALAPDWNEAGIVYQSKAGIERTADEPAATTRSVIAGHNFYDPDWQPSGGRIVYQQKRSSHWQIFAVNPDGSGDAALTRPATTLVDQLPSSVAPAWSPDGRHIVFLSNREENGEAGQWRLWVMDADGGNQRPLPVDVAIDYGFVQEQMVSWGG